MERLQALLDDGAKAGWYPLARAVVLHRGKRVFEGGAGAAAADLVFDLASLTKVMCTTAAFLTLWADGLVGPDQPVSRFFPGSALGEAGVTLADLLYHRSGAPAFAPLFADVMSRRPELFAEWCPPEARVAARAELVAAALAVPPAAPRCAAAVYSDIGFIVLGEALAQAGVRPLDALFEERVAERLGISASFRRLSEGARPLGQVAPTGVRRPREPAPGQEATPLWMATAAGEHPSPPGEVDDDNAWAMDGVAGHAGLFGTADDVAAFGQAVLAGLEGNTVLAPATLWSNAVRRDNTAGSTRAMGFDTPARGAEGPSSAGTVLGDRPPGAVGHLGFTGVSLWIDLARHLVVALCTNRTYNGRAQLGIRELRPAFHDAVLAEIERA